MIAIGTETRKSDIRTRLSQFHVSGATVGVSAICVRRFKLSTGPRGLAWTYGEITRCVHIQPSTIDQKLITDYSCSLIILAIIIYIICGQDFKLPTGPRGLCCTAGEITQCVQIQPDTIDQTPTICSIAIANHYFSIIFSIVNYIIVSRITNYPLYRAGYVGRALE